MKTGSVFGILSAIAGLYGLRDATELCKLHGLKPIQHPDLPFSYLEKVLETSTIKSDLQQYTDIDVAAPVSEALNSVGVPKSKRLKVCKACIAEGVLHQPDWQRIDTLYCDIHHQLLVNACDHLYVERHWPKNMHCLDCFTESKTSPAPDVHVYLKGLSEQERIECVTHLLTLAPFLLRPFDYLRSDINWERYDAGAIALLINDAFLVAGHPDSITIWGELRRNQRATLYSLGNEATQFEDLDLEKLLACAGWQTHITDDEVRATLLKYHHFVSDSAARDKKLYFKDDKKLSASEMAYRINHKQLYQFMGVSFEENLPLGKFFDDAPFDHRSYFDKAYYNIRSAKNRLDNYLGKHQTIDSTDYVSLFDAPQTILEMLCLTKEQINYNLLFGKLNWYFIKQAIGQPVNRVFLSVESILALSEQTIDNSGHLPLQQAMSLLHLTEIQVRKLIELDWLAVAPNQQSNTFKVSYSSLRRFLKEKLLLNREAALDGMALEQKFKATQALCNSNINTINCNDQEPVVFVDKRDLSQDHIEKIKTRLLALPRKRLPSCDKASAIKAA